MNVAPLRSSTSRLVPAVAAAEIAAASLSDVARSISPDTQISGAPLASCAWVISIAACACSSSFGRDPSLRCVVDIGDPGARRDATTRPHAAQSAVRPTWVLRYLHALSAGPR